MNYEAKMESVFQRLSKWDKALNFKQPIKDNEDIKKYLEFYGFDLGEIQHYFGTLMINEIKIIAQVFSPQDVKGTIFLLHGYFDHVGQLKNIIQYLVELNYRVVSYDLQGHGFSAGESASVKKFDDYVLTLETVISKVSKEFAGPFYIIGHSTGGAIALDYVLKHGHNSSFEKVILIAPLIRSNFFTLSKIGYRLMDAIPVVKEVSRKYRENSSDKKYLDFTKKDPLQPKAIPLKWLGALIEWNRLIKKYRPTYRATCMIQGEEDKTVDWKYNKDFIQFKFKKLQMNTIKDGKHHLINEKREIREEVFSIIHKFLSE